VIPLVPYRRAGRIVWATLAFMAGFAVLIVFVSRWYLIPALQAAQSAQPGEKRQLAAHSSLLLAIILFILIAGILLTFRFGRYFTPRLGQKTEPTKYVDAWTESAKRISVPPARSDKTYEDGEEEDGDTERI
jgi:formate hydrogenlyase subunit 3/multisubunit Na+/H+ antiporter MnhD subunit